MKLPVVSGKKVIKFLVKHGYETVRQKGSHVNLKKTTNPYNRVVVPLHDEINPGTLNNILKQADITRKQFIKEI